MGFKDKVKSGWGAVVGYAKSFFGAYAKDEKVVSDVEAALRDFGAIAVEAVEAVAAVDLNGDGRVKARQEIVDAAKTAGVSWGRKFISTGGTVLLSTMDIPRLKRELAIAKMVTSFAAKGVPCPATSILNLLVELAVSAVG